jgi:capsular polysaccharide biosynthesis protein
LGGCGGGTEKPALRIARPPAAGTPEKIFISRLTRTRKHGAYRGLNNEEALIEVLHRIGFVAVEPEQLPLEAQVALFRNARSIVGLGGAAMVNTAFCRPGTRVVTIESTLGFIDGHTNIFGSLGLDYGVILGDEDRTDQRPVQWRWRLDVPRALEQIAARS